MDVLDGRTAFVTGAASGIGLAVAEALVAEGARVAMVDCKERRLRRATDRLGDAVIGLPFDVRDRDRWPAAQEATEQAFGPVDILVNNAGVAPGEYDLVDMPAEHFDRLLGIMLTGIFNGIHTFGPGLRERGDGHIVNTASIAGLVASPGMGAYTTAKWGVVAMSEALRAELAPHGVGVSVLCPALVRTNIGIEDDGDEEPAFRPEMAGGMDPARVAARVLGAIRSNELHVLTHGGFAERFVQRAEQLQRAAEAGAHWQAANS